MSNKFNIKKDKYDYLLDIANRFNRFISLFIKTAEFKEPTNVEILRAKRLITLGKAVDEMIVIKECWKNIWKYKDAIYKKNIKVFDDYNMIKHTQEKDYEYNQHSDLIFKLTGIISNGIKVLTKEELNYLWSIADDMVLCVAEYKALNEHGLKFYLKFKEELDRDD